MADEPLTRTELERYARHIVLREIGGAGQVRLKRARVLVVGAGGLGSPSLLYLAAAGVGRIEIVDDDLVSLSNLQRQVLHATERVGVPKTSSARETLRAINPEVEIAAQQIRITEDNAAALVEGTDAVLDGSDTFRTRDAVNRACARSRVPLVSGAIGAWDGSVSVFRPWLGGPCWRCVFPAEAGEAQARTCAETGVLGALAGVIGSLMAAECVKLIAGAGHLLDGRLLLYDALDAETRVFRAGRRAGCTVCGDV